MKGIHFDWSTLDRRMLFDLLWAVKANTTDITLTIGQVHSIIGNHLKDNLPIRVNKKYDNEVEPGWIYVGGSYYHSWDQENKKCISVDFVYHPNDKKITLTKSQYKRICLTVANTILHEIIHMRQYRRRNFRFLPDYESKSLLSKQRQEQRYLGCSDEIDAYSFNIACELVDKFKNDTTKVVNYLTSPQGKKNIRTGSYRAYLKAFEYDHNHPIIKRLKKRVLRYLPNAILGKPYKNKDWISC